MPISVAATLAAAGTGLAATLAGAAQRVAKQAGHTVCEQPAVEETVAEGSWVVARLRRAGPAQYIYGQVRSMQPFCVQGSDGKRLFAGDLKWAIHAKDQGWLQPSGREWQQPGRMVFLRLLANDEWVAARVAGTSGAVAGKTYLKLEGVDGVPGVNVEDEVGLLFTPHEECLAEFANMQPGMGGFLIEHLARALVCEASRAAQKRRWTEKGHVEAQYPMRCVWVHPRVKEQALAEFVGRCHARRAQAVKDGSIPDPEVVVLLGPPAAGKSSIQRLPAAEVPPLLRGTAASLQYREEVNNDNLTDCMPGFADDFRVALELLEEPSPWAVRRTARGLDRQGSSSMSLSEGIPGEMAWAMRSLVYLMFHHGPVRDSLAWDINKVTVVDAQELSVYYSSVMAGKAIGRTMDVLDMAHSTSAPVPHAALRIVGFWPYASQEARNERQKHRHRTEKDLKKLLGGNVDSNLINLHFHAHQAENNISKLLDCLYRGVKPSDDGPEQVTTDVKVDHFLMIDNNGTQPRVLLDWANLEDEPRGTAQIQEMQQAARRLLSRIMKVPEWSSVCHALFRVAAFFLPEEDPLLLAAAQQRSAVARPCRNPSDVLPLLAEVDEAVFMRLNSTSPALLTTASQPAIMRSLTGGGFEQLEHLAEEDVRDMKEQVSKLRKFCCVQILRTIRDDSDSSGPE